MVSAARAARRWLPARERNDALEHLIAVDVQYLDAFSQGLTGGRALSPADVEPAIVVVSIAPRVRLEEVARRRPLVNELGDLDRADRYRRIPRCGVLRFVVRDRVEDLFAFRAGRRVPCRGVPLDYG